MGPDRNILLYYDSYCGEASHGGTEVATSRIAKALKATGRWNVFNACKRRRDNSREEIYADVAILRGKRFVPDLAEFIRKNDIEVVVNMGRFYRHPKLQKAIGLSGKDVRLMFMHHFAPGSESKKHTYRAGFHLLKLNPSEFKYWIRATLYPIFKLQRRLCLSGMYRKILEMSSAVVLLSEGYKKPFLKKAFGNREVDAGLSSKLVAIPNIFDTPSGSGAVLKSKGKRVLVLSRMDEIQKRISLILEVWNKIEKIPALNEWHLDIVGSGDDMAAVKKLAKKMGLKRAVFHGWQQSKPFLERSSILVSTSDYEGLPLSMLEAQVYGVVPVAFNSYASLADVIENGKTGVIVDNFGDTDKFAESLADLMEDDEKRARMALQAQNSTSRFSSEAVAEKWIKLIE